MDKNFIKTSDLETKNKLVQLGYELVQTEGTTYVFLNSRNLNFSKDEEDKIVYSNILSM